MLFEVELGGLGRVLDIQQWGGGHGLVEGAGDDEGDRLAVVVDVRVLKDSEVALGGGLGLADLELGRVEGREHGDRRRRSARRPWASMPKRSCR